LLIATILLALILDGLDLQLLSMVGPKVIEEWQISTATFSQALASAIVGVALGAAFGGWAGDFAGHRRVLLWSMFACALVTGATALVDNIFQMASIRFFTGIAIGTISASALVYVTQALAPEARASVGAITGACGPAGGMLGSGIVLAIEPSFGWHACFIAAGGAMFLTALILAVLPSPKPAAPDLAVSRRDDVAERSPLFVPHNRRMNIGAPLAFAAITYMGFSFAWTPVILTKSGLPLSDAVVGYLAYNVMALISPLVAGLIIARVGTRRIMIAAGTAGILLALALANALAMHQLMPSGALKTLIFLGIGGIGASCSMLGAVMNGVIACGYAEGCRGRGVGFSMMMGRIGGLASIVIGGILLDTANGPSSIFYVIAAGLVLVISAAFIIDRHLEPRRQLKMRPA
jgi:MFS family permease